MVLDRRPSSSEFPSEPNFVSDPADRVQINYADIPSPLPILGPLFFFTKEGLARMIASQVQHHGKNVGRPLTPDEIQAIAYHTAKANAIASWGPPSGFLLGLRRAYRTRENFRHPFIGKMKSANGWFDGERIRILGRELLRGDRARALLHGIRTTNYCLIGAYFALVFSSTYGATVAVVGKYKDPRLKDISDHFRAALRRAGEERQQQMSGERDPIDPNGMGVSESRRDRGQEGFSGREGVVAGTDVDEGPSADGATGFEYAGDSETGDRVTARLNAEETQQPNPILESAQPDHHDNNSDFPLGSTTTAPSSTRTGGSSSTWERIRREASFGGKPPTSWRNRPAAAPQPPPPPPPPPQQQQQQEEGSSTEDDFTFSASEQERSYAKEEAQQEFDERVERERRGGDFGTGAGERRWS